MSWFTANPALGSALIGAGGNIASSLLGGGSSGQNKSAYREATTQNFQALVRTARAEKIHPLYALGTSSPSPLQKAGGGRAAQAVRGATQALAKYPIMQAEIKRGEAAARLDDAQAAYWRAKAAQEQQTAGINKDGGAITNPANPLTRIEPVRIPAASPKDPSRVAGETPMFKKYRVGTAAGTPVYIYGPSAEEPAEAFENVGGLLASIPKNAIALAKWYGEEYRRGVMTRVQWYKAMRKLAKKRAPKTRGKWSEGYAPRRQY
ncbi:hypothetical protein [Microviridae sp.]|nr:hypothetical protein [Microviridae sp.]